MAPFLPCAAGKVASRPLAAADDGRGIAWAPHTVMLQFKIITLKKDQTACKPGSVRPEGRGDHSSWPPVAGRLAQPTRTVPGGNALPSEDGAPFLFGLAPGGACRAAYVAASAVRSYRTLSPLPCTQGGLLSVALSLGSPPAGVTRRHIAVEPGLSSRKQASPAIARPSGPAGTCARFGGKDQGSRYMDRLHLPIASRRGCKKIKTLRDRRRESSR